MLNCLQKRGVLLILKQSSRTRSHLPSSFDVSEQPLSKYLALKFANAHDLLYIPELTKVYVAFWVIIFSSYLRRTNA